ncbi:MAG: LamG domain-containing protein [Lachnoclostridium sp.]
MRNNTQALYVTKEDGTPILKDVESATIVFDSYFEGNADVNDWVFYAAKDIYEQPNSDPNYIAMLENTTATTKTSQIIRQVSSSSNTGTVDFDLSTGHSADPSGPMTKEWKTVAVVIDDAHSYFYVDGVLMDQYAVTNGANLTDILGDSGGVFRIGRANWKDGEFYNGKLDNFRIYDGALTKAEVETLYTSNAEPTDKTKIAEFTFDDYETGFSGAGAVARPFLIYDTDNDGNNELYFEEGNKTYLSLLQGAASPLKGQEAITISYDSKPYSGKGWVFYAAEDDTAQVENKEKYISIQNYAETIDVYNWNNEPSGFRLPSISTTLETDDWKHIDIIIDSEKTALYVNGVKKDEVRSCYPLSTILGDTGGIAQIGKGNWGIGQYYRGYIDNFQIYDKAIEPKVDSISVTPVAGAKVTESGAIKVLAGICRNI